MVKGAWVTLATNDSYSLGALVLAHSLKQVGTQKELAILITPGVTNSMRSRLSEVFNSVKEVNILDSKDKANLKLLQRPELGITFTKLHCWQLTEYEKCVFLDADTLVLQNCDELFEREELSAAPDVGWPDCFNSGVFVYRPSEETYNSLVQFALDKGSFDGGDQGLLNLYFSDWAQKDISKHLPFIYNVCSTAFYSYLPAFKQFGKDIKIIHFIGNAKPWLQYFDTESKTVRPSRDLGHLEPILQMWWNIFCSMIHPNLSTDMISSYPSDPVSARPPDHSPQQPYIESPVPIDCTNETPSVWDPWEEYERNQSNVMIHSSEPLESHNTIAFSPVASDHSCIDCSNNPVHDEPFVDHNDQQYIDSSSNFEHYPNDQSCIETFTESSLKEDKSVENCVSSFFDTHKRISHCNHKTAQESSTTSPVPILPQENSVSAIPTLSETSSHECIPSHINEFLPEVTPHESIQKVPEEIPPPQSCIPSKYETEEERDNVPCGVENEVQESGLAGAFARLTLGQQRTPEQEELENCLRRQNWEQGNIDYLGRDSFDNIWSKICQTLAKGPQDLTSAMPRVALEKNQQGKGKVSKSVSIKSAKPGTTNAIQ
ncbi:uncharacterized protein LOC123321268 isoform X3 [Coccinella septempunctata]|uniref:uncharacterized protein LOC123321268 isoform X3 n=1 Tax=Coccinella septempunctata TaxID=41139 RepID=UPI001D0936B6|nr:uncharacterized protein LOC123321268 isoform X3 [Coccinella septempunctata]